MLLLYYYVRFRFVDFQFIVVTIVNMLEQSQYNISPEGELYSTKNIIKGKTYDITNINCCDPPAPPATAPPCCLDIR